MRRYAASLAFFAIVVGACVGADPTPTTNEPADGGSSSSSGSGGDASTVARSITCDAKLTCNGTDKCCGVGIDWIGASCKPDCGGAYALSCDDAKDCASGQVCCYTTDGGARAVASFCATSCRAAQNELQLCAIGGTECVTGSCTPLTQFSPNGLAHCL